MTNSLLDKVPAYLRIQAYIKDKINRGTVRHALSELVNEDVIYKIHGKSSYVKPNVYEQMC
jgi:DNA-binding GntR family transcriptional regulator